MLISFYHQILHPNTTQTYACLDPSRPLAKQCFCRQVFSPIYCFWDLDANLIFEIHFQFCSSCFFCEEDRFRDYPSLGQSTASPWPPRSCGIPWGHASPPLTKSRGVLLWRRSPHATLSVVSFDFSVNSLARLVPGFVRRRTFSSYVAWHSAWTIRDSSQPDIFCTLRNPHGLEWNKIAL